VPVPVPTVFIEITADRSTDLRPNVTLEADALKVSPPPRSKTDRSERAYVILSSIVRLCSDLIRGRIGGTINSISVRLVATMDLTRSAYFQLPFRDQLRVGRHVEPNSTPTSTHQAEAFPGERVNKSVEKSGVVRVKGLDGTEYRCID